MWTQRFVSTAGRSRLAFRKEAHCFCQIRNTSTSLGTRENKGTTTRNFFLGVGFVSAGLLPYPSKVYAAGPNTKWKKWTSDYKANEENPSPQVAGLRGMGATQTVSSNFDAIFLDFFPFTENTGYVCIGIYDGHHGGKTAINLSKSFPEAVSGGLGELHLLHAQKHSSREATNGIYIPLPGDPTPPDEEIDETIRRMFDDDVVHDAAQKAFCLDDALYTALQANNTTTPDAKFLVGRSGEKSIHHIQDVAEGLRPTWCGAGALLGIYNVEERTLQVGLTGNSRAVLGRRVPVGQGFKYEAHQLTTEQDTSNSDEVLRLTSQHPDEHDLLKDKRFLGYSKTRVFGDGPMKCSRAIQTLLYEEVIGDPPSDDCLTPPYATAEPVVTTMKDIKNGDFALFASDGLWESLTSEEVVGLVRQWLEVNGMSERAPDIDGNYRIVRVPRPAEFVTGETKQDTPLNIPKAEYLPEFKTYLPSDLPAVYQPGCKDATQRYKQWKHEKKFLCEDDSVCLHLMRNALGGANVDISWALTYLKMPMARRFRDDIAIIVVFFD